MAEKDDSNPPPDTATGAPTSPLRGTSDSGVETANGALLRRAVHFYNQGVLHEGRGENDDALAFYQQAIETKPDFAEAHNNLGNVLMRQGRLEEALSSFQKTIALKPDSLHAYNNLGNILAEFGRLEEATTNLQRAIALDPTQPQPYIGLAMTLGKLNRRELAVKMVERALQIQPDSVEAHIALAQIHLDQGEIATCIGLLQRLLNISPGNTLATSILLFNMHYIPNCSAENLFLTTKRTAACFEVHDLNAAPYVNSPDPGRRLRIGYVSGDFYIHPVGYFMEPALAHHDKSRYEIFCYYNNSKFDELTGRLQGYVNHWRNIYGLPDSTVARKIREDHIDILIDLSGYNSKNRISVFARKPAPVQVTWLGYGDTTGLNTVDYIIGDRFLIPPEEEEQYTEQVVRLPNAYLCFFPSDCAIESGPLPALTTGGITFGCFNNIAKVNEAVIACWAKILQALPQAQLRLKYKSFGDETVRRRYQALFTEHGIDAARIRFTGSSPRNEHLAAYQGIDICLDPFPYNGCTTTMESLWMGVPVVTLISDRYVGHMGETILKNLGLTEYVTESEEAYIARAITLASDLPRLAALRSGLRSRLLDSPLCDGPGFTRDLEAAYRRMWEAWCRSRAQPA